MKICAFAQKVVICANIGQKQIRFTIVEKKILCPKQAKDKTQTAGICEC
jgi:tRNA-binding EMAP/Myf-like protein